MEMIFHSYADKTRFHKKGCALGPVVKVRGFETRKWSISSLKTSQNMLTFVEVKFTTIVHV